jgi:peptidoglycan/xylan/chitin deacetylase (PgdA/CDA1 family)
MVKTRTIKNLGMLLAAVAVLTVCGPFALTGCGGGSGAKEVDAQANLDKVLEKGIKPNEMGMVMVLEYHRIQENEGNYVRSIDNFKRDLETLYKNNYRLITFKDLMTGNIGVPAGTTPVVFSFDDSTESQFRYLPDGTKTKVDPECAVGMMEEFAKTHKDFGRTALFNVMPELFDQAKYKKDKLDFLTSNGYEIGNHTLTHPALGKLTDDKVQAEIAGLQKDVTGIDPKLKLDILCLPYGSLPQNQALMFNGSSGGGRYHNKWSLLVGSNPFYPVYHYKNPGQVVPRVQVMDYNPKDGSGADGSGYWLRYFERHPELRFISDGNSKTVCAPAYMQPRLLPKSMPAGVKFIGY